MVTVTAEGLSHDPCDEQYCGPSPASEPETLAVQSEAQRLVAESRLQAWLTVHSFGRVWMFPWAKHIIHWEWQFMNEIMRWLDLDALCKRASDHDDLVINVSQSLK